LFRNVKTWCISMLSSTKQIYLEYHPLIAKMHVENVKSDGVGKILSCLCDVEVILRFKVVLHNSFVRVCTCID
jgi:hypothetical protein